MRPLDIGSQGVARCTSNAHLQHTPFIDHHGTGPPSPPCKKPLNPYPNPKSLRKNAITLRRKKEIARERERERERDGNVDRMLGAMCAYQ